MYSPINYSPYIWKKKYQQKYNINEDDLIIKYHYENMDTTNVEINDVYCLGFLFSSIMKESNEYISDIIQIIELFNNKKINFDELLKWSCPKKCSKLFCDKLVYYNTVETNNSFLLNIHNNFLFISFLIDSSLSIKKLQLGGDILFLKILLDALKKKRCNISDIFLNECSSINDFGEYYETFCISIKKNDYNSSIKKLLYKESEKKNQVQLLDQYEKMIFFYNVFKVFMGILIPEKISGLFELLNGCFVRDVLVKNSKLIYESRKDIEDKLSYLENVLGMYNINDHYIVIPFNIFRNDFVPSIYWQLILNENNALSIGEHAIIFNNYKLKIKVTEYEQHSTNYEEKNTETRILFEKNVIKIEGNYFNNEINNIISILTKLFYKEYNESILNNIKKEFSDENDIYKHFSKYERNEEKNFLIKISDETLNNYYESGTLKLNTFLEYLEGQSSLERYMESYPYFYYDKEKNEIYHILLKMNEFELVFEYLPLLIGIWFSMQVSLNIKNSEKIKEGIEKIHKLFEDIINYTSSILSPTLLFTKDKYVIEKNIPLFKNIFKNTLQDSFKNSLNTIINSK